MNRLSGTNLLKILNTLGRKNAERLMATTKNIRTKTSPYRQTVRRNSSARTIQRAHRNKGNAVRVRQLVKNWIPFWYNKAVKNTRRMRNGTDLNNQGDPITVWGPHVTRLLRNNPSYIAIIPGPNAFKAYKVAEARINDETTFNIYNKNAINRFFARNPGLKAALNKKRRGSAMLAVN